MDEPSIPGAPAGFFRRLAALAYDALLVVALWFIVTFAMLPLTGGEAILASSHGLVAHFYHAALLLLTAAYFGFCWLRGGQTLGMRAWRIRLERADGGAPGWLDALVRFTLGATMAIMAVAGLWYLRGPGWSLADGVAVLLLLMPIANLAWVKLDRGGRSLQDLATRMRVSR